MAKNKAIYAPGELDKVRGHLGDIDEAEAKRMAQLLGGEVGYERSAEQEKPAPKKPRRRAETVDLVVGDQGRRRPRHGVEPPFEEGSRASKPRAKKASTDDDPATPVHAGYFERLKMDRYCSQPEFDIKSAAQVLQSMLSLFAEPPDYVSASFVNKRLAEYYGRIEQLVTGTRTLLPRNNMKRNEKLKRTSPFVFTVLDTIRYWNIERIASEMGKVQSHPRSVKMIEFADILRAVYKPIFTLELLDMEAHIKGAYKLLYKLLYIENPMDAKDKYQDLIRNCLVSFSAIRRDLHYMLYPMLMKLLSNKFIPYERFFVERHNRFTAFLGVTDADRIDPADMAPVDTQTPAEDEAENGENGEETEEQAAEEAEKEEDPDDPAVIERKAREKAAEGEKKAMDRGLSTLEILFPKAGWDRLSLYPDLYPYFADMFNLKRGYELIAPTDPVQQVAVFCKILEELFIGLRYVTFGAITGADGAPVRVDDYLNEILINWHSYVTDAFSKVYLPRLTEYCNTLENPADSKTSTYVRRLQNELHWAKRVLFLPYYKFDSIMTSPFHKGECVPLYPEIRTVRKYLTAVAAGIEQGNKNGGAEKMAPCDGIDNPWEPYNFEVPNPLSIRLDALLAPKKRTNAALIFYTLSVVTVLDQIINYENSYAYEKPGEALFRSINGDGSTPQFGVDTKIDADVIFRQSLKDRAKAAARGE